MEFKITLKNARQIAGLTQEEVAKEIGVEKNTICRWEKTGKIRMDQFDKLIKLYQVPSELIKR